MVLLGSSRIRRTRGRSEPCSARARLIGDGGGALQQEWQDRRKAELDAARQDVQFPTRTRCCLARNTRPPLTLDGAIFCWARTAPNTFSPSCMAASAV